jgi:ATP-dependent RNA helicase DeaD
MKFSELDLDQKTLNAISNMGWETPTEVQEKAIQKVREGRNLIVRSQTGTGKTGAFGIGLIERLAAGSSHKALILTPTRELALQVCKELREIGQEHRLKIYAVFGGQSINLQIKDLEGGFDILVATPGRLLDLGRRKVVDISEFDAVVLDEADHMLDLGFMDEVTDILKQLPEQRTMMLFSATIDESILNMASTYIPNPETIEIGEIEVVSTIKEEHVEITRREKFPQLMEVLQSHQGVRTLIFMETKRGAAWLWDKLQYKGYRNVGMLQGDMTQAKRNAMLAKFKKGSIDILVATNVAARGLHIDDVGLIVNYDKAETEETHLHRVGRTGRMGAEGKVVNFVPRKESKDERMADDHPDFAWMKNGMSSYSNDRNDKPRRDDKRRGKKPFRKGGPKGRGRKPRKKY